MAEEDEEPPKKVKCPECKPGAPLWMATFADMATLLMAFFVLILSFSETKVDKYKAVVGSLSNAFGMPKVQIVPMGATVIPSDFSPSISTPSPINKLDQEAIDPDKAIPEQKQSPESKDFDVQKQKRKLEQLLQSEIMDAQVEVKLEGEKIVVELKGPGVSGQEKVESPDNKTAGTLTPERIGLVAKVSEAQKQIKAEVEVRQERMDRRAAETDLASSDPKAQERLKEEMTRQVAQIKESLKSQIDAGSIEIERRPDEVAIMLAEQDIFQDGGAAITPEAVLALEDVRDVIMQGSGKVVIAGHTDKTPIFGGGRYDSNWDLSSARAAAVAHAMSDLLGVPESRIEIEAHADTRPIAENDTEEGRRKNRRIEILLRGGGAAQKG